MNHPGSSGIGVRRGDVGEARERDSVEDAVEENAERFAQALLPYVAAPVPATGLQSAPTDGWRPSVGVMTPAAPELATSASATESGANTEAGERIVLSVQSPDNGELSLVLDRSGAGVRVTIGVEDARAAALMLPEREALAQRLAGSGVRVHSVQIVARRDLGTLLAQARTTEASRGDGAGDANESENQPTVRRRASRKLDVIG